MSVCCAGPAVLQDAQDVYCSKQTGSSSTSETTTHHFFVSGIGQKKTVDAAKICGGAENVVKTETPANIRKWIARFCITLAFIPAGSACIAHNNCMSAPSIKLYLHCSLIYFWVPSSCFCIVISLWGWNNPVQRCSVRVIHAGGGGGFTHWFWSDCLDVQPTTTSGNIITQSIIFSFSIS